MAMRLVARVTEHAIYCAIPESQYDTEDYDRNRDFWRHQYEEQDLPREVQSNIRTALIRQCPEWFANQLMAVGEPGSKFPNGEEAMDELRSSGIRWRYI